MRIPEAGQGAVFLLILALACDGEPADTDPAVACPEGEVADGAACVPEACGVGPWGHLEADAGAVYVDASGEHADQTDLQAAADLAGAGGQVAVAAGTYGPLVLGPEHEGLAVHARCADLVTLEAPGETGITATVAAEVRGITVGPAREGVRVSGASLVVGDLVLRDLGRRGVVVEESASLDATAVTVDGAGEEGVHVSGGSHLDATGLAVHSASEVGVRITGTGTTAALTDVEVVDTATGGGDTGVGLEVAFSAEATVTELRVSGSVGAGISLYRSQALLDRVHVSDTTGPDANAVEVRGADLVLHDAEVEAAGITGVYLRDGEARLARVVVRGDPSTPEPSKGLEIAGATADIEDLELDATSYSGLAAVSGATVFVEGLVVRGLRAARMGTGKPFGAAVYVREATLGGRDWLIDDAEMGGLMVALDGVVEVQGVEVLGVHPDEDRDDSFPVLVNYDGRAKISDLVVRDAVCNGTAVYVDLGGHLEVEGLEVSDGTPGPWGTGCGGLTVEGSSTAVVRDATLERLQFAAVQLVGSDGPTSLVLEDFSISGVTACPAEPLTGYGILAALPDATLEARRGHISSTQTVGLVVEYGAHATLEDVEVEGVHQSGADYGWGLLVGGGGRVDATGIRVGEVYEAGIVVWNDGTVLDLSKSAVQGVAPGATLQIGMGALFQSLAIGTLEEVTFSDIEGPGIISATSSEVSCTGCEITRTQLAGALVSQSGLALEDALIDGVAPSAALGGGMGLYAPDVGDPTTLTARRVEVTDTHLAAVYLNGPGSYRIQDNDLEAASPVELVPGTRVHGDGVLVRQGATRWDGSAGLLLQANRVHGATGAGLVLDEASATLQGNTWSANAVDLVRQGCEGSQEPDGMDEVGTAELCPDRDRILLHPGWAFVLAESPIDL